MNSHVKRGLIIAFILFALPSLASTVPVTLTVDVTSKVERNRVENRLEEIKAMDKTSLTRTEKRALRDEVKALKKLNSSGGGIYLSLTAIIIIVLLLIILL